MQWDVDVPLKEGAEGGRALLRRKSTRAATLPLPLPLPLPRLLTARRLPAEPTSRSSLARDLPLSFLCP